MIYRRSAGAILLAASLLLAADPAHDLHAQAPRGTTKRAALQICKRETFRIVVDVGHTPQEPGATSARGATEYEFNLRLAERIERSLLDAGFASASLLVTDGPARKGLLIRASRAAERNPDLFVSVHHDSVPEHFLEEWEFEGRKLRFSDRFSGYSMFVSLENPEARASLQFGALLGRQLQARGLHYTPHYTEKFMGGRRRQLVDATAGIYRFDELWVLRAARSPAILFEAGSIVNRDEELLLASDDHRNLLANAVTDAVEQFCRARRPSERTVSRVPAQASFGFPAWRR